MVCGRFLRVDTSVRTEVRIKLILRKYGLTVIYIIQILTTVRASLLVNFCQEGMNSLDTIPRLKSQKSTQISDQHK